LFQKRKEAKLRAERQDEAIAELRRMVERLLGQDGVVSPEGFREFVEFAGGHNLDLNALPDLRRAVRLGLAQGGMFLATDTTLLLKKDEAALLEAPVSLLKEVTDKEFRGGSRGVSVPLGGGVRYRAGAFRGHMVTIGSHWEPADTGTLTVTDRRVVYHGGRKTLEFPFAKLAAMTAYSDAINLGVTTRQTTSTFRTGDPELLVGIIHAAVNHQDDDVTIMEIRVED